MAARRGPPAVLPERTSWTERWPSKNLIQKRALLDSQKLASKRPSTILILTLTDVSRPYACTSGR